MPEAFCTLDEHTGLLWHARETQEEADARFEREVAHEAALGGIDVAAWRDMNAHRRKPRTVRIACSDAQAIALTRLADRFDAWNWSRDEGDVLAVGAFK